MEIEAEAGLLQTFVLCSPAESSMAERQQICHPFRSPIYVHQDRGTKRVPSLALIETRFTSGIGYGLQVASDALGRAGLVQTRLASYVSIRAVVTLCASKGPVLLSCNEELPKLCGVCCETGDSLMHESPWSVFEQGLF